MASLTVNPTTINVTDINQNVVTVNFTSDKTLTDVKLSMDNGNTYKNKTSMTQTSAVFDITDMSNNNYTCKLKGYYEETSTTIPVQSVSLNKSTLSLKVGESETLVATVLPSNATNKTVNWSSNNYDVISVSNGMITANRAGTCVVTATTQDSYKTATCSITVTEDVAQDYKDILLSSTEFTTNKGDTLYIPATITIAEQYPAYELRKNGEYFTGISYNKSESRFELYNTSALQDGLNSNLKIYAMRWVDGVQKEVPLAYEDIAWSATFSVTVGGSGGSGTSVTGVNLDITSKTVSVGESFSLYASVIPSNATDTSVTWSSSNASIVGVSSGGFVSAYNTGTATITARTSDGGYTANCTVTVTSSGGGDGGNTGDSYDTLNLMYPMPQPHGAIPNGAPTDWKTYSRWENQYKPSGWRAFGGWAQVYRVDGTSFSQNTGVEIKNYKVYGWKNNQWTLVTNFSIPYGSFYAEDFTDDANNTFPSDRKTSPTNDSVIIRLTANMTLSTSKGTKNVCYHPFTSQMDYDTDFEYIYTCVDMRKVKWDESGIDDRDSAKYCASCGGDWWREPGLQWAPDWSNNKGIAQPKIMEVQNDWKTFSMSTVPQNWSNGFPL